MTKVNKRCSHSIRHVETCKVGRAPSHPKGRDHLSLSFMKFLNEQYGVTSMNSWSSNIEKFHICTRCYKYEVDQLKNIRNFPTSLELVNNENESAEDIQLH